MDELDRSILGALEQNARASLTKIGHEVGLTAPAVAQRITKMENSGLIQQYTTIVDHTQLGFDIAAQITLKCPYGKIQAFGRQLTAFPEIRQCQRLTGEDCVLIYAWFRNNHHLVEFLEQLAEYGETKTSIVLKDMLADESR
ncbi:MAG: Lrp/AsnC family transcriptional regulator [Saprospiraceae bacterium]|nr:Lrp/AsnC family transcriptional regulator [Saprospiraceae bacterium]